MPRIDVQQLRWQCDLAALQAAPGEEPDASALLLGQDRAP